jgi:hypothetical protein
LKLTLQRLATQYGSLKTTLNNNLQKAREVLNEKTVQRQELEKQNLTLRSAAKYGQHDNKYGQGSPSFYKSGTSLSADASSRTPTRVASLPDTLLGSNKPGIPGATPPDDTALKDSASPK